MVDEAEDEPDNVIELAAHRRFPHLTGQALCTACDHRWQAVAPVGTLVLDCPSCGRAHGTFANLCEPPRKFWECNCGETLFFALEGGELFCRRCGVEFTPCSCPPKPGA